MQGSTISVKDFVAQKNESRAKLPPPENRVALTPEEWAIKYHFKPQTVRAKLLAGAIPNAEKVGGRWLIYEQSAGFVPIDVYQKAMETIYRLEERLDIISRASNWREAVEQH